MKARERKRETRDPVLRGFGSRLKSILEREGLSASELARRAELPIPSVTRLLKGERLVELQSLLKIARALAMGLDELLEFNPTDEATGIRRVADRGPRPP